MSEISNLIHMDKASLKKLSKSELINLLLKQHKPKNIIVDDTKPVPTPRTYKPVPAQKRPIPTPRKSVKDMVQQYEDNIIIVDDTKPVPTPRTYKPVPAQKRPIPTPRKSVKDMVQQYEDNIISPPPEFRDDYKPIPLPRTKKPSQAPIPTPRTKKPLQAPIPTPRTKKPVPEKRTIISQVEKALKGYTKSFDVEVRDEKDPLLQLQKSKKAVQYLFNNLLVKTKGFKFVETLQVKFVKYSNDKKIQKNGYFNSTTDLIINETDIKLAIQASQQQILNKIAQWVSEGSGWTIQDRQTIH